jgi:hypothetical protein
MATRHNNGPQGDGVLEADEDIVMPPVFETGPDGEDIFDPDDAEDESFDQANDSVAPIPEPVGSDAKRNQVAAVDHIERAVAKLGYVYSCSVVLRLAHKGQNADQDYELAECLNRQVTTEVGRIIYRLVRAAKRLGRTSPTRWSHERPSRGCSGGESGFRQITDGAPEGTRFVSGAFGGAGRAGSHDSVTS